MRADRVGYRAYSQAVGAIKIWQDPILFNLTIGSFESKV